MIRERADGDKRRQWYAEYDLYGLVIILMLNYTYDKSDPSNASPFPSKYKTSKHLVGSIDFGCTDIRFPSHVLRKLYCWRRRDLRNVYLLR